MIFDPILDPASGAVTAPEPSWQASWIWFPGQLGAHLNTTVFQKAIRRCTHIGYPGNFAAPRYQAEYRLRGEIPAGVKARWSGPAGRVRVRINGREGDITARESFIPAGPVEILAAVDLTVSLPCFLFDAPGLASGLGWEASLDGREWVAAEFQHPTASPSRLPDQDIDLQLTLTPRQVVSLVDGKQAGEAYYLAPGGELVLDFWHNELGDLELNAAGEGQLSVYVGESIQEVMEDDPTLGEQYPLPDLELREHPQAFRLAERCLRYVRLRAGGNCQVSQVRFHARLSPVEYRGWFECGEERLDEIWKAGAATLHSNIHDAAIVDGLKRDALIWLFDQNIDIDGADLVFFDREIVRNTLVSKFPPPDMGIKDIGILDMRLYFILGIYQDYLVSGDAHFVRACRKPFQDILSLLEGLQDEQGFIPAHAFSPQSSHALKSETVIGGVDYLNEYVPDWAGKSDRAGQVRPTDIDAAGTPAYAQMMLMRAFELGALFAGLWGDEALAARWTVKARQLRESIPAAFWDPERGLYINGLTRNGVNDRRFTLYAQAWAILTGLVPREDLSAFAARLAALLPRPANLSMSTYWEYLAYLEAGRFDLALEPLRRHWGWMLDQGYTRFIEDIRPGDSPRDQLAFYNRPYGLSLNHGWTGAAAVSILMRGALGLRILQPGYRLVELSPAWRVFPRAKITVPTPMGNLSLVYNRGGREELEIPEGMRVVFGARELPGPGCFSLNQAGAG